MGEWEIKCLECVKMGTYILLERGPLMHGVGNGNGILSNSRSLDQQKETFNKMRATYRRLHPNGNNENSNAFGLVLNKLCGNKGPVVSQLSTAYQAMPTQKDVEKTIGLTQSNTDKESTNKEIDTGTLLLNNALRQFFVMYPRSMFLTGRTLNTQDVLKQLNNFLPSLASNAGKTTIDTNLIRHIDQIFSPFLNTGNESNTPTKVFSAILSTIICQPFKGIQGNLSAGNTPSEAVKMTVKSPFKGLPTSIRQSGIWWTTFSIARENDISQNDAIFLATAASTPDGAKSIMDAVRGTTTWRTFLLKLTPTQGVGLAGMVLSSYLASKAVKELQSYNVEDILKSMKSDTLDKNLAKYLDEPHNFKFD